MIKAYFCFQVWVMLLASHGSTFLQGSFKLQGSTESKVSHGLPVLTLRFRDFFRWGTQSTSLGDFVSLSVCVLQKGFCYWK